MYLSRNDASSQPSFWTIMSTAALRVPYELPALKVERLDDELLDFRLQQTTFREGVGTSFSHSSGVIVMQESMPAACTSAMERSRTTLDGQNGSNARPVLVVGRHRHVHLHPDPPRSSILRKRSQSRATSGLRVWTTSFGLCHVRQDLQKAPRQV